MLVLSRKQDQEIIIGENIKISVLKVQGNNVRLGIEAPRDVKIIRGELPRDDEPQLANVTVVFNDPVNRTNDDRSEVLKFEKPADQRRSVSFRQLTPDSLKHSRLQEIAKEIAASKSR